MAEANTGLSSCGTISPSVRVREVRRPCASVFGS